MKSLYSRNFLALAAVLGGLTLGGLTTQATTYNWTNSASGGWNTAANWNPNGIPNSTDTAIVTNAGVTVSLNGATSVGGIILGTNGVGPVTLSLNSQTLTLYGPLTVNPSGSFTVNNGALVGNTNAILTGAIGWTGGSLAGTLTFANNSVFNIAFLGGGNAFLSGLVLTNYGTVTWTNTQIYGVSVNNAKIYNYGMWIAQSDNIFTGGFNGGTSLFNNFGTFIKSGNAGSTILDANVVFNNTGIVSAQSGTLSINGGGVNSGSGTFTTANGGLLNLYNMTFANNATISSATVVVLGGNTTIKGVLTVTNAQLVSGTLGGTNMFLGTLTWSGGSLAGNMTLASNSVLNIVAGGGDGFSGLILTNYGTVNWTNTTLYGVNTGNAQIYNYGLWNAQSDNQFQGGFNGGTSLFNNFGTFLKSGGTNTTVLDGNVVFNNTGTVNVQSGTLGLYGGGTSSSGTFITDGGGNLNVYGYTFTNSTTFTGPGNYVAGGTATFGGAIMGMLNWDGGSLAGTATLTTNSVLNIVAGGGDGFSGLTLTNYGTVNWTNTPLYGVNVHNAQIYNYGLWNAQSDNQFQGGFNGGTTLFDNFGTFLKSGGTNTTVLDGNVVFNNTGTVSVQTGTLGVHAGTTDGGNFATAGGAFINFYTCVFTNSNTFTGTGSAVSGDATFAGTITGTLNWNGGNVKGLLTLANDSVFNIAFGGGNAGLNGLTLTNYGTVTWTNTQIYGVSVNNAKIYNYGMWIAQSDNIFTGGFNGGTSLFNNFGTFIKSGNAGSTILDANVVFNNTGIVSAQSGTLSINGGGVNSGSGTFTTANGGLLNLYNMTFANNATISSATVVVLGGNTTIKGVLTVTNAQLVSGTLGGTNMFLGTLTWSGGSLAGNMTLASNSVLNIVAGGGDGFSGLILTNYGTVNWTNTTLYGVNTGNAQIYNYGLWNAQSDNQFQGGFNGGTSLFNNFGTFLKSGGTNVTILNANVVFNNTGTVNVQSGTLGLYGGGTSSSGTFITSGGGSLNVYGYTFTNSTTFTGPGNYVAGGTATFGGAIMGMLNWDGGSLAGTATLTTNSVLNIVAGGGDGFSGLTLTNYGTVNWTNTPLYGVNVHNAQIYNYGLWNAQSDNQFQGGFNGGTTLFDNFGTFLKSGGTNTTVLDGNVVFNNTGTVSVQTGTLGLHGGGTGSGSSFSTAGAATLNIYGYLFTNSNTFTGSGNYVAGGATFAGTVVGTLGWDGGTLSGVMTLANGSVFNITFGGGNGFFTGLVLTNYGTVNWINTALYGENNANAQIHNYGLWNAQSDNTFTGGFNGGTSLFDNFGTFLKSGNAGTTILDANVVFNNTGTVNAQAGSILFQGADTFANGTQMRFGITDNVNYGRIVLSGPAAFSGGVSANFKDPFYWPLVGTTFNLLSYTSETGTLFTNTVLPAFITWTTNYGASVYSISVAARSTNPAPATLYMTQLNSSNLFLKWYGDRTGWELQAQTNTLAVGLSTNWSTVPGSSVTNKITLPVVSTNPAVFFRLVFP